MGVDHFETDEIHVMDTTSTRINPSTEETLQAVLNAVDGLELSVDNIDIDMDDLETLIAATNAALASLTAANDLSGDDTVAAIEAAETSLNAALAALQASNETHSDEEQAAIASLEAVVTAFKTAFDVRDLATETTVDAFKTESHQDSLDTQDAIDELKVQNGTKHDSIISELQDVNTELDSLSASELWGFLKTGNAPTLDHIFKMEAPLTTVYRYHGFATRGTATSASTWSIMRIEFTDIKKEEPIEFLVNEDMAWDDRVSGGTEGW